MGALGLAPGSLWAAPALPWTHWFLVPSDVLWPVWPATPGGHPPLERARVTQLLGGSKGWEHSLTLAWDPTVYTWVERQQLQERTRDHHTESSPPPDGRLRLGEGEVTGSGGQGRVVAPRAPSPSEDPWARCGAGHSLSGFRPTGLREGWGGSRVCLFCCGLSSTEGRALIHCSPSHFLPSRAPLPTPPAVGGSSRCSLVGR